MILPVYRDEISHVFDQAGIPYFIDSEKGLNYTSFDSLVKKALCCFRGQDELR